MFIENSFDPEYGNGYVYVMSYGDKKTYKIGCTKKLSRRIAAINKTEVKMPTEIELVLAVAVPEARKTESFLHLVFNNNRVRGEWFELEPHELIKVATILQIYGTEPWESIYTDLWYEAVIGSESVSPFLFVSKEEALAGAKSMPNYIAEEFILNRSLK